MASRTGFMQSLHSIFVAARSSLGFLLLSCWCQQKEDLSDASYVASSSSSRRHQHTEKLSDAICEVSPSSPWHQQEGELSDATSVVSSSSSRWCHQDEQESTADTDEFPSFDELYSLGEELGRGGFGVVYAGFRKSDYSPLAFKFIYGESGSTEIELLLKLQDVPGVIQLFDFDRAPECDVLVLERPQAVMDLHQFIFERNRLCEEMASMLFYQIVQSVIYCFDRGVLHRDIKCENILINLATLETKLIDFGCGCLLDDDPDVCYDHSNGTPIFNPPEWHRFGLFFADSGTVWSLGIVLYVMVCGMLPFHSPEDVLLATPPFTVPLSEPCVDLIRKCFGGDSDRLFLRCIPEHGWFQQWFIEN